MCDLLDPTSRSFYPTAGLLLPSEPTGF